MQRHEASHKRRIPKWAKDAGAVLLASAVPIAGVLAAPASGQERENTTGGMLYQPHKSPKAERRFLSKQLTETLGDGEPIPVRMGTLYKGKVAVARNPIWETEPNGEMDHVTVDYGIIKKPLRRFDPPKVVLVDRVDSHYHFVVDKTVDQQMQEISLPQRHDGTYNVNKPLANTDAHGETIFPTPFVRPDGTAYPIGQNLLN